MKELKELRELFYGSIYNDYMIIAEQIASRIESSIYSILNSIDSTTQVLYSLCFAALAVYLISILVIVYLYYRDTSNFLSLFVNLSTADLIKRVKAIEKLKKTISEDTNSDNELLLFEDFDYSDDAKFSQKVAIERRLVIETFVKRLAILLTLIIPSIVLLVISYNISKENYDSTIYKVSNIIKMEQITFKNVEFYYLYSINDLHYNNYYFKNLPSSPLIDSELEVLGDIVSSKQDFSPEVEAMLSENLCNYYNGTSICRDLLNGVGYRGLRSYIYYVRDLYLQERAQLRNATWSKTLILLYSTRQYRNDIYAMISGAIIPANTAFVNRLGKNLLDYLDLQTENIIHIFIASLVVGLLSLMSMIFLIYYIVIKERKRVYKTIYMVPLEMILGSKHFKMYMIKENKEFNKVYKTSEQLKKNVKKKS